MKTGAIIQARMGSGRLPGKVLLPLPFDSNCSILNNIVERLKQCKEINEIIIATTDSPKDDVIEDFCKKNEVVCFRGDEKNVLSRFYFCAVKHYLDVFVRLTADNPIVDTGILTATLKKHLYAGNDYTTTRNYPRGIDVEVVSVNALKSAFDHATSLYDQEHVTSFLYDPINSFKIENIDAPITDAYSGMRLTIDVPEDYTLQCFIFDYLFKKDPFFSLDDVVSLYTQKPWLKRVNSEVMQKRKFTEINDELKEAIVLLTKQSMDNAVARLKEHLND